MWKIQIVRKEGRKERRTGDRNERLRSQNEVAGRNTGSGIGFEFSFQLCPLPAWPLIFIRFLLHHIVQTWKTVKWHNVGECVWLNWERCVESLCLGITAKQNHGARLMMKAEWERSISGVNSFGCSQLTVLITNLQRVTEHCYYVLCITQYPVAN